MGTKVIKSEPGADAGVVVSNTVVRATVKEDKGIMVDERGTTISGPVSFVSSTSDIRFGGLWTMNNPIQMSLPSTYATPTPTLMIDPPVKQLKTIMADAAVMIALLGGLSAL
jgi:hypothetical protein